MKKQTKFLIMTIKNYRRLLILPILFGILISCSEEAPVESKVTNYAIFNFPEIIAVAKGSTYTPTGTATEGGEEVTVDVSHSVNTNVVGVYEVIYEAENSDGFTASAVQTVVVHDPVIVGSDVTGCFYDTTRPARTGCITLVPGTTSIFYATDFGFGGIFPMYFQMNGDVISDIPQPYLFGVSRVDLTYDPVTRRFTTLMNPQGFAYTFAYN